MRGGVGGWVSYKFYLVGFGVQQANLRVAVLFSVSGPGDFVVGVVLSGYYGGDWGA